MDTIKLKNLINSAKGQQPADLIIKNGRFLDVFNGRFVQGDVAIQQDHIAGIADSYAGENYLDAENAYIVPGFIDAHVHIESSLLTPFQFQKLVLPKGTTTIIWDPHEISNVKGTAGIKWALDATENLLLCSFIMLPSCVPATNPKLKLETNGATLTTNDLQPFSSHSRVLGLAEIMDFPSIMNQDEEMLQKLTAFSSQKLDGHCPLLTGKELNTYACTGIHSCHESTTLAEAQEKLMKGLHILIREGSCAKNADTLLPILTDKTATMVALCTDDRKPNDILTHGHIDNIINKGLQQGIAPEVIFRSASFAPALIYGLQKYGAIAPGYMADFCIVRPKNNNWINGMEILQVYKNGQLITTEQLDKLTTPPIKFSEKNLNFTGCKLDDLAIASEESTEQQALVIGVTPGQILTDKLTMTLPVRDHKVQTDLSQNINKIAVFERHKNSGSHSIGLVKGFNLTQGAIATSISHDSHNIVVIGANDNAMLKAIQLLQKIDGGIVDVDDHDNSVTLPLPIGGLMTNVNPKQINTKLHELKALAATIGCTLEEPFLQLSFLSLPVIPSLKISDCGLIDVDTGKKVTVCI